MAHGWDQSARPGRRAFPPRIARRILRRDPECALRLPCCTGRSEVADHVVGYLDAVAAGWDPRDIDDECNGQGVCRPCHAVKTRREAARGRARAQAKRAKRPGRRVESHPGRLS